MVYGNNDMLILRQLVMLARNVFLAPLPGRIFPKIFLGRHIVVASGQRFAKGGRAGPHEQPAHQCADVGPHCRKGGHQKQHQKCCQSQPKNHGYCHGNKKLGLQDFSNNSGINPPMVVNEVSNTARSRSQDAPVAASRTLMRSTPAMEGNCSRNASVMVLVRRKGPGGLGFSGNE